MDKLAAYINFSVYGVNESDVVYRALEVPLPRNYRRASDLYVATEILAMHRHGRNIPGGSSAQHNREHGPEMEEDSLNTASTFVKCALDRSSSSTAAVPPAVSRAHAITANFA